ncbi:MAG: hypothetical protein JSV00_00520, partial [bacterium]
MKRVHDFLNEIFEGKEEVLVGIINGVLYIDDYLFYEPTPYSGNFLKTLSAFEIDDLLFLKGVDVPELLKLAAIFKGKEHGRDIFMKMLEKEGLVHVKLKSFHLGQVETDLPTRSLETYRNAVSTMRGYFDEVGVGKLPPLREAEEVVNGFMESMADNRSVLLLLTSLKGYDAYTYQHCVNV